MADEPKPRREIRIPIPDMGGIKASASKFADKAKEVNRAPPKWLYWVVGIGILLLFQFIRVATRY